MTIGVGDLPVPQVPRRLPALAQHARDRDRDRAHRLPLLAADAAAPAARTRYGFVDTLDKYPTFWSFNSGAMKKISNQYAAMPSVHCCWALWCACALVPRLKHWWAKWLAALYPVLTVAVIVMTANHYFLDAVGGFIIFGIGYVGARLHHPGRPTGPAIGPEPASRDATRPTRSTSTTSRSPPPTSPPTLGTLVGDLGGTVFHGGDGYGFRWVQARVGDRDRRHDDRVARGVASPRTTTSSPASSPGTAAARTTSRSRCRTSPAMLDACAPPGSRRSACDLDDPHWQEAFLQPREAHGTVVQLAQTTTRPTRSPTVLAAGRAARTARARRRGGRRRRRAAAIACTLRAGRARQPRPRRRGRVLRRPARRRGDRRGRRPAPSSRGRAAAASASRTPTRAGVAAPRRRPARRRATRRRVAGVPVVVALITRRVSAAPGPADDLEHGVAHGAVGERQRRALRAWPARAGAAGGRRSRTCADRRAPAGSRSRAAPRSRRRRRRGRR